MSEESCQRCGELGSDRRNLWMKCMYDMDELKLPFGHYDNYFILRVCKSCRADWMSSIATWFRSTPNRESVGSGIFVRENGATVEISREEWDKRNPGKEPMVLPSDYDRFDPGSCP